MNCFNCCSSMPTISELDNARPFIPPIENTGTVVKVYDGDTLTVVAKLTLSGSPYYKFSVRLNGIDTPEMRGSNKDAAIAARDALSSLTLHKTIRMENIKTEKYGRLLADIYVDDIHVNAWLLQSGYAKPYFGGKKE